MVEDRTWELALRMGAFRDSSLFLPCNTAHHSILTQVWIIQHSDLSVSRPNKDLIQLMVPVECNDARFTHSCLADLFTTHSAETHDEAVTVTLAHRGAGKEQLLVWSNRDGCLGRKVDQVFPREYSLACLPYVPHFHCVIHRSTRKPQRVPKHLNIGDLASGSVRICEVKLWSVQLVRSKIPDLNTTITASSVNHLALVGVLG